VFLTSILIITGILSYLASFVTISVLPVIGSSLKVGVGELALVLAAQVAGLAVLQIPAGVLALRFGARWVYLAGVFLSGFSYVATALSRNVVGVQLGVFGGGSGEAIILGTSVSLLASCYPESQRGPLVGLFWGSSNGLGGMVGLPLGIAVALSYGWSTAVGLTGVALLIFAVLGLIVLRKFSVHSSSQHSKWFTGKRILRSRAIWGLALGMTGDYFLGAVLS